MFKIYAIAKTFIILIKNLLPNYCLVLVFVLIFSTYLKSHKESYSAPKLTNPGFLGRSFGFPDTQTYVKFEKETRATLETMTAWLSENIDALNYKMVLCTGIWYEHNGTFSYG